VNIDSSLVVKDSVTIEKSMTVQQDMRIEGDSRFNNVDVYGNLKVLGSSEFNSNVFMPSMGVAMGTDGKYVLVSQENGLLERFDFEGISHAISDVIYSERNCGEGPIANPNWANGPNKIYSNCPQVRVGIGTNSPTHGLNVTTDVKFNSTLFVGYTMGIGTEAEDFARLTIKNTNRPASLSIKQLNTGPYTKLMYMEYSEPSTEVLKVVNMSTGNTSYLFEASGKMTVNNGQQKIFQLEQDGLLRLRKVRVDAETWADYVFEKDYKLMPLNQVEQFINENGHLPNIPSEHDVKKEGVDLVEMNMYLLEKIEELTLHLINQDKQIKQLVDTLHDYQKTIINNE